MPSTIFGSKRIGIKNKKEVALNEATSFEEFTIMHYGFFFNLLNPTRQGIYQDLEG